MLKYAWVFAACLLGAQLSAETIGNVEFQFPPSKYEWRLFMDENFFQVHLAPDECIGEGMEEDCEDYEVKLFTHREGDAFELFMALQLSDSGEDDDEEETLATAQKELDEAFNQYFPNHKLSLLQLTDRNDEGFIEWELRDLDCDLLHGYGRGFTKEGKNTSLFYFTTALRTEHNKALWTGILNDAR